MTLCIYRRRKLTSQRIFHWLVTPGYFARENIGSCTSKMELWMKVNAVWWTLGGKYFISRIRSCGNNNENSRHVLGVLQSLFCPQERSGLVVDMGPSWKAEKRQDQRPLPASPPPPPWVAQCVISFCKQTSKGWEMHFEAAKKSKKRSNYVYLQQQD